ncbi:HEAT repeat domain-containing protein [Candidatus Uabimicrobium sp. HlEnr_7]|uniref:HEAT repeat domain-containing protein n=1 Tax=Candidatus Uabimicrobium helgolandensis TaxID=3095367 RepID=UPI003556232E
MSETKTLRSVLGEQVNIPKSYARYLDCSVVSQQQKNIFIKTPKGNTLIFKVEDNSLKKLTATSHIDVKDIKKHVGEANNTTDPKTSSEVQNLQKSVEQLQNVEKTVPEINNRLESLEKNSPQLIDRLKHLEKISPQLVSRLENLEKISPQLVSRLENLQKVSPELVQRLESIQKFPQEDIVLVATSALEDVQKQLQKNEEYQQRISSLEKRIAALEKNTTEGHSASSKTETMQKVKEGSGKIARGSAKAAVTGSKFLWHHPRVFGALIIVIALFSLQPWNYFSSSSNENSQNNRTSNSGTTNYIIAKGKNYKSKTNNNRKSQELRSVDDGNYLSAQDRKYSKELKEPQGSHIKELIRQLNALSSKDREIEIRKLSDSRDPSAGKVLVAMLKDKQVAWSAIRTLGELRYRPSTAFLVEILENKSEPNHVRAETCTTLGILGNPYTAKLLKRIFLDKAENEEIRLNAGLALGVIGDANVSPDLLEVVFYSKNPVIRQAAITTLGKFQYPAAVTPIIDVMNATEDIDLRRACIDALGNVRRKANEIAPTLLEMLEKGDPDIEDNLKASLRNLSSRLTPKLKERVAEMVQE